MAKVHITAVSFLSPLGNDLGSLARRLRNNESGVRALRAEEVPADFPVQYAAKLESIPETALSRKAGPGSSKYALAAAWLAEDISTQLPSGLEIDSFGFYCREQNAFPLALQLLRESALPAEVLRQLDKKFPRDEMARILAEEKAVKIARVYFSGSACTSGSSLIGAAFQRIRAGEWRRALVSTVELDPHPLQMMGLHLLGALSTGVSDAACASRPFSAERNGFVKGEAATLLLLESEEAMQERGAKSLGEILGYSNTSDAWRFTEGHPEGKELSEAMRLALADASLSVEQIDYIKAHATSTPSGDKVEVLALKKVFGAQLAKIPVNAPKSQLGHSTVSAASMELIAVLAMLRDQFVSPTLNYHSADPGLGAEGMDIVGNESRAMKIEHALLNSGGFGGQNSCLVLKAPAR